MEVLAGVIIGILVTLSILKKPITININRKNEDIHPEIPMPDLAKEMKKPDAPLDQVYSDGMKGFIDDVNNIMLGGRPSGETNK